MSTIKVTNIEHESTGNGGIQLDSSGHVTVDGVQMPSAGPLSNRNLVINGAMNIAQRGTTSTANGYQTVDRFKVASYGGTVTQSHQDLSSGDPYNEGFRHFYRMQNTTAATGASNYRECQYHFEAQDLAQSGWQYTSTSSYVTLSFWARASVAQDYYVFWMTRDGADKIYSFPITLAANTWTKITETIPGNAGITINNDNGDGMLMSIVAFYGTTYTDSGNTDRTWRDRSAGNHYMLDMTNTWANTTNATFDVTGVQAEVGEKATPFEHRSYGDELARCQRYFYKHAESESGTSNSIGIAALYAASQPYGVVHLPTTMRAQPSVVSTNISSTFQFYSAGTGYAFDQYLLQESNYTAVTVYANLGSSATQGDSGWWRVPTGSSASLSFSAEL